MKKAKVVGDKTKNRLIILTRPEEDPDIVHIKLSDELNSPEFVSTRDLKNGEIVNISITTKRIWEVQAGEKLKAGAPVVSGKDVKIVRDISGSRRNPARIS